MKNFWKVCAALDNPVRLRMVNVLTVNEPCSVGELSEEHQLGITTISRSIRALDDVGLLAVDWCRRKAYYRTEAQNRVAEKVLAALQAFFAAHERDADRVADLLAYIHALSHPRRAAIVRYVWRNPGALVEDIAKGLGMAYSSVDRMLGELDHAYIVDMQHRALAPEVEPERTFFELTVS